MIIKPKIFQALILILLKINTKTLCNNAFSKSVATFLRPNNILVTIKSKVSEPFLKKKIGCHLPCQSILTGDVGDMGKTRLKVLSQRNNSIFAKERHIIIVIELRNNSIGFPFICPLQHTGNSITLSIRRGHSTNYPRLAPLRICQNSL